MMKTKKTQGRRQIEIKKIQNMKSRQVTLCKRRTGVFNKASELCVLTGAQIAVLVQSSGDKVYSFGHPNVDSIIDNYLGDYNVITSVGCENSSFLNQEEYENYLNITQELEYEKNMSKMSKTDTNVEESGLWCWWEQCVDNLEIDELEMFVDSMEKLKDNVAKRADELTKMMVTEFSSPNNIDLDDYRRACSNEFQNDVTGRVEESEVATTSELSPDDIDDYMRACSNLFDQDNIRACLNNVTDRAEESKEVTTSEFSLDNVDLDDYMRVCSDQFQNNVTEEAMLTTSLEFDQDDVAVWDDIWAYVDQLPESTNNDVSVWEGLVQHVN